MCGIFGYVGDRKISEVLIRGLKKLEYRGYDSCGFAILNREIVVRKSKGFIDEVVKKLKVKELDGSLGISHTRWATHGKVDDINAHPHLDCKGEIAIVHNGILENYWELKEKLERVGHRIVSETDSELIAHLIEEEMKLGYDFVTSCKRAFEKLKGSFAVLAIHKNFDGIVAIRKDSPLVLGIGDSEVFISSDIPALLEFTKKVVYLSNYDFVIARKNKVEVINLIEGGKEIKPEILEISASDVEKGNYEHYMLKEILEQIEVIKRASMQRKEKFERIAKDMKKARNIYFVAAGTSYHASLAGSYLFSKIGGVPSFPIIASEFSQFSNSISKDDLVIAVSQSGETADVLEAVRTAKRKGAKIIAIINVYGSSLMKEADEFILVNAGPEIGVAATKTYTAQLVVLLLLAYTLQGEFEKGRKEVEKLANISYDLTSKTLRNYVKTIAEVLRKKEHVFLIGRGLASVTAREAALKIKEISYIHAEAFPGGEIKHGPLALIEKGTPCIVFVDKENRDEILSNAMELKSRGAFVIGVSSTNSKVFDIWLKTPENDYGTVITQVIPMQILAYELAVLRGLNPDKPRNLAKSVTVK